MTAYCDDKKEKSSTNSDEDFLMVCNKFSAKLFQYCSKDCEKLTVVCPFGLFSVFGMLLVGLTDTTLEEVQRWFLIKDKHQIFDEIVKMTEKLRKYVNISNITMTKDTAQLFAEYLKKVEKLGNPMQFKATKISKLVGKVNALISENTGGLITDLMKPNDISDDTFLILINTIYMNLTWGTKFAKNGTRNQPFFSQSNQRMVEMMKHNEKDFKYFENDVYQALNLPYNNHQLSMIIVLPKDTTCDCILLNAEDFHDCFTNMETASVNVDFPKFEADSEFDMVSFFKENGMGQMFNYMHADDMIERRDKQKVDAIRQKNLIKVDENGTRFVSATAVSLISKSICRERPKPRKVYEFIANHPFAYYITHHSGLILCCGTFI